MPAVTLGLARIQGTIPIYHPLRIARHSEEIFLSFFHGANDYSNICIIQKCINKIDRLYYAFKSTAFKKHSKIDRQINMQVVITLDKTEFMPCFFVLELRLCRNRNT